MELALIFSLFGVKAWDFYLWEENFASAAGWSPAGNLQTTAKKQRTYHIYDKRKYGYGYRQKETFLFIHKDLNYCRGVAKLFALINRFS